MLHISVDGRHDASLKQRAKMNGEQQVADISQVADRDLPLEHLASATFIGTQSLITAVRVQPQSTIMKSNLSATNEPPPIRSLGNSRDDGGQAEATAFKLDF